MIAWTLETMVAATLLMLLVLAVRKPVAELFGAQWAYALWLLPVLIPLLPPVPLLTPIDVAPVTIIVPDVSMARAVSAAPAPSTDSADWMLMLLAVWLGGALAFAVWQQSAYSAFMLHLGPKGREAQPPSFGGIKVVESDAVDGPVAVGLIRRRIVVPVDFQTRYSAAEQRLALEHELVHHRRFDLLWNWVGLGLLTVNWFNPIAHIAFRAFRADQELSCDAAVTMKAPAQRHDYACALVKSASRPGLIAVCPLNHVDMLKRRLRMMKKHRASWARTGGGVAALSLLGAGGLVIATPGFANREAAPARVVVNTPERDPVIAQADIARLREKCGRDEGRRGDAIVCSDEEARDPEVKAIMAKTMKRVHERVEHARLSDREMANIRKSVEQAQRGMRDMRPAMEEAHRAMERSRAELAMMDHGPQLAQARQALEQAGQARQALEQARIQIAQIDIPRINREAMESTMAAARVRLDRVRLSRDDLDEIREALDQAREEIDDIDAPELDDDLPPPAAPRPPRPPRHR